MQRALECLLSIVESPYLEKPYENLQKFYQSKNMDNEAEAIRLLITKRFHGTNNNNTDKK